MSAETVFRRDQAIVLAALAGITAIAWLYLHDMSAQATAHAHHAMPTAWGAKELLLAFVMWNVMMVGMMIPTASPMILTFTVTNRRHRERRGAFVPTAFFVAGYIAAWAAYSAGATLAQWGLHTTALLAPETVRATPAVSGALLVAAGVFQWSTLKYNCLTQCRSPLAFLLTEWREGRRGALVMGMKHGAYCVGCCWAIMTLMLVAGAMNLLWTAVLAIYMLLEKVVPRGHEVGRAVGVVFVVGGILTLWQAL